MREIELFESQVDYQQEVTSLMYFKDESKGISRLKESKCAIEDGFDLDFAPGHLIRRAQQVHTSVWASVVGEDLTSPQFAVLNILYARPGIDQTMLSSLASLDTSTCQDIVARLRHKGLIERSKDGSDGRRWLLRLSERGKITRNQVVPKVREVGEILLRSLDPDDRATLTRLLYEVARGIDS